MELLVVIFALVQIKMLKFTIKLKTIKKMKDLTKGFLGGFCHAILANEEIRLPSEIATNDTFREQ